MSKLTQGELMSFIDCAWSGNDYIPPCDYKDVCSEGKNKKCLQALTQLKEIVRNAYTIPTTSEREAELEKIIIKMQDELDKKTVTREYIKQFLLYLDNLDKTKSREEFIEDWFKKEIGVGVVK